jgi:hypothetical protein
MNATRLLVIAFTSLLVSAPALAKRTPDVKQALAKAYPDATTEVTNDDTTINGVRIYDVKITGKKGQSTAQITEFGDFLMHGEAVASNAELMQLIEQNTGQLFAAKPSDIQAYRTTTYITDVPVQMKGKKKGADGQQVYRIRFDAVGRVLNILDPEQVVAAQPTRQEKVNDKKLNASLEKMARERFVGADAELQGIYKSDVEGYYDLDFINAAVTINEKGDLIAAREDVNGPDLPAPVRAAISRLVKNTLRSQRVEETYFQFDQKSETGNSVVVKMRPNGEIVDVVNSQAEQDAVAASAKQAATNPPEKNTPAKKAQ